MHINDLMSIVMNIIWPLAVISFGLMSFLNQYCDDVWRGVWGCSASLCRRINNDYELNFGSVHRASRLIWWGGGGRVPICAAYWILDTEADTGAWQYQTKVYQTLSDYQQSWKIKIRLAGLHPAECNVNTKQVTLMNMQLLNFGQQCRMNEA